MRASIAAIAIFLLLTVFAAAASCAHKGDLSSEYEQATAKTTDDLGSFGGAFSFPGEVRILGCVTDSPEYGCAEEGDSAISEELYLRNQRVEERLGVALNFELVSLHLPGDRETYLSRLNTDMNSGTPFALVAADPTTVIMAASHGLFTDLLDCDAFFAKGISDSLLNDLLINDRLYGAPCTGAPSFTRALSVTVASAELLPDCGVTEQELLQCALDGAFTAERLLLYTEMLDTGGRQDTADCFGLLLSDADAETAFLGFGGRMTDTEDGKIRISDRFCDPDAEAAMQLLLRGIERNERNVLILDEIITKDDRTLFRMLSCSDAARSVTAEDDKLLLPLPKASISQKEYVAPVGRHAVLYAVPVGNDRDVGAAILTELSSVGDIPVASLLFEEFYGEAYGENRLRSAVFERIRASGRLDFGVCASPLFRGAFGSAMADYASRLGLRALSLYRAEVEESFSDELASVNDALFKAIGNEK